MAIALRLMYLRGMTISHELTRSQFLTRTELTVPTYVDGEVLNGKDGLLFRR